MTKTHAETGVKMDFTAKLHDMFGLNGKVAVVTGATKGLGKTVALMLAESGANVALCSRNHEESAAAAKEIAELTGSKTFGMGADVSKKFDVDAFVAAAKKELGSADILVACAGINIRKEVPELTEDDWSAIQDINVKGSFLTAQAILPDMSAKKWGSHNLPRLHALVHLAQGTCRVLFLESGASGPDTDIRARNGIRGHLCQRCLPRPVQDTDECRGLRQSREEQRVFTETSHRTLGRSRGTARALPLPLLERLQLHDRFEYYHRRRLDSAVTIHTVLSTVAISRILLRLSSFRMIRVKRAERKSGTVQRKVT